MSTAELAPDIAFDEETVFDGPETITWLGPESAGMRMSKTEFHAVENWDELYNYELIRGLVVVSPSPAAGERGPNGRLDQWLWNYHDDHPLGKSLDDTLAEQEIDTGENLRRVDRAIWTGLGRVPNPRTDIPTIVIEIVSKRPRDQRRDYEDKRAEYAAIGVKEYWVFDRYRRTLTVCVGDKVARVAKESESYESPLLPGFVLEVGKLLTVADRYSKQEKAD